MILRFLVAFNFKFFMFFTRTKTELGKTPNIKVLPLVVLVIVYVKRFIQISVDLMLQV